jgi:hypothetical protein
MNLPRISASRGPLCTGVGIGLTVLGIPSPMKILAKQYIYQKQVLVNYNTAQAVL